MSVETDFTPEPETLPQTDLLGDGQHFLETEDGSLTVFIRRSPNPDAPLILYSGGTAFTIDAYGTAILDKLSSFGDVVMWDYPVPTSRRNAPDLDDLAKLQSAANQMSGQIDKFRRPDQTTIYWGHSLGGFVSAQLIADDAQADAVILENTAASATSVAEELGGRGAGAMVALILPEDIATFSVPETINASRVNVLVIGGARDRVLPVNLSRDLAAAIPGSRYIEYESSNHFDAGFQPSFQEDIQQFLETVND